LANFNPAVQPTNDPNWLGWSKSITQPEGDKSAGVAISETGNLLDQGLKTADFFTKSTIQDQIIAGVDKERNAYTSTLAATNDAVHSGTQTAQAAGTTTTDAGPLNILSISGDKPLPAQLGNLSSTLSTLDGAKANGKLSETAYYGRLDSLAKDLRSRYPGYRDYIDNEFKNVSGVDAANKYLGGMISDINSFSTFTQSQMNKDLDFLKHNVELIGGDFPAIYAARQAGRIDSNEMNMLVIPKLAAMGQYKMNEAQLKDLEGNRKLQTMKAEDAVSTYGSQAAASSLQKLTFATSEGQKNIADLILQHETGKIVLDAQGNPISDVQWTQMGQAVIAERNAFVQNLRTLYNQPGKDGGRSVAAMLGPEKLETALKEASAGHDLFASAITNKETGTAFGTARLLEAQAKGNLAALYKEKGIGPLLVALKSLNDAGGPQAVNSSLGKVLTTSGFTPADVDRVMATIPKLLGQPDMRIAPTPTNPDAGKPYTAGQAIEDNKANGGISNAANKYIADLPSKTLADPKMGNEAKINTIKAYMSPSNAGYISKFALDGKAPGKFSIFSDMLSNTSVSKIWELSGKAANSDLWKGTKQWATSTFGSELFPNEIRSLNEFKDIPGVQLVWNNGSKGGNLGWTAVIPKTQEMNVMERGGPKYPTPDQARYVQASINRLNTGINAMANVYKQEGSDPNVALVNLFKGLGINPGDNAIPAKMFQSVISSHAKPDDQGLLQGRELPFSQEPKPRDSSLGAFLRAPIPSGIPVPNSNLNAPVTLQGVSPAPSRGRGNLTNEDLLGMKVDDIPEGMSARDFLKQLQSK